jgi:hypothetical protein
MLQALAVEKSVDTKSFVDGDLILLLNLTIWSVNHVTNHHRDFARCSERHVPLPVLTQHGKSTV